MKILCYGVRSVEKPIFEKINKRFNYKLKLVPHLLTNENVDEVKGFNAILVRENCICNHKNLDIIKNKYKIKYILTRTAGLNHIDIDSAKKLNIDIAYVPIYSLNAISELAVSLTMNLTRHSLYASHNSSKLNFIIDEYMFSKEIRNSTIGIIGLGNIGITTAKLFYGIGAKIIGNDIVEKNIEFIQQVSIEELAKKSDVIVIHCPYIHGVNENLINENLIDNMKNGVILINLARGELQDIKAIIKNIKSGKIHGFATDVLKNENKIFGKKFNNIEELPEDIRELINLYPKVLITPHIGSYTDEAVVNMIECSFENLKNLINKNKTKNIIT